MSVDNPQGPLPRSGQVSSTDNNRTTQVYEIQLNDNIT